MTRDCFRRLLIGFVFLFSTPGLVLSEDHLPEEVIVQLFGNLNRPADVLLGEADASVAKATLSKRLQQYLEIQRTLSEQQDNTFGQRSTTADEKQDGVTTVESLEHALKMIVSDIRAISDKLDSSWLSPVDSSLDDRRAADLLNSVPQMQVTIRSKNGVVLNPAKLTLVSPTAGSFRFAEIRSGVYIANPPAGEYQLGWQLTDKSIVQRTKIEVTKNGQMTCEITLGPPKSEVKSKWSELNISGHQPTPANIEFNNPPDLPK